MYTDRIRCLVVPGTFAIAVLALLGEDRPQHLESKALGRRADEVLENGAVIKRVSVLLLKYIRVCLGACREAGRERCCGRSSPGKASTAIANVPGTTRQRIRSVYIL